MSDPVTPLPFRIPIGYLSVDEVPSDDGYAIYASQEWFNYWTTQLFNRLGGTNGLTTQEVYDLLASSIVRITPPVLFNDATEEQSMIPGPPGKDGVNGITTFIHIREDVDDPEPYFIRIP
jgi:hypothetical protein